MLQLLHRDHARYMTLPLSSAGSVSPAPIHADMRILRPIPGVGRSYVGGVHLLLPPLSALGLVVCFSVTALGAWLVSGRDAGMPGCRASGEGM